MDKVPLICPDCFKAIADFGKMYKCDVCGKEYSVKEGVICFMNDNDKFYEGQYSAATNITFNNRKSLKAKLFFGVYREPYQHALAKYIKKSEAILDIGCAGGVKWIAQENKVAGLDLSFVSVKKVISFYDMAVQADCLKLPFPEKTFDKVISAYLFEHLANDEKRTLLNQVGRVIKPGGLMIFIFDCDSNNPLFKFFKKDRNLFKKCFIEHDHHYGLETASFNLELISKAGFSIVEYMGLNKTILQYLPVYSWMEPYGRKSKFIYLTNALAKGLSKSKLFWVPYYTFLNWFDSAMEKVFPIDYARLLVVVARKN